LLRRSRQRRAYGWYRNCGRLTGFAEVILWHRRHLNPSSSNSLDWIHPRLCVSHLHYDAAEDPPGGNECIHDSDTGFPCRHPECNYILVNRNHVHPRTPHPTLTPNITTSVLFPIKYYQICPRSTMRFLATVVVLFRIVIINEGHFVTTTIMHSRIFKPETMDNSTTASGRRGYKRLPNHGQNPRSPWVNGGEIDRPLVSIHYL
jgi:hypothetical protein